MFFQFITNIIFRKKKNIMNNELSIIIPTHKYTKYLDKAISSCLSLKFVNSNVFVNINSSSKDFEQSSFWNDERIQWRYIEKTTPLMYESINNAVDNSYGDWLFILSDDDVVHDNFLKEIDLNSFTYQSIFLTRTNIIDEYDNVVRTSEKYTKNLYTKGEAMEMFFNLKIHNHLSLMVFSRELFQKVKKFCYTGYPNCYYLDTVFHGKAIANSDQIFTSNEVMFSRRESSFQGSSHFYFGEEVNTYFDIIVNAFFEDKKFKKEALKRYGSKENFFIKMLQNRFKSVWYKLNKPIYNKSITKKIEFVYKHIYCWNTGIPFKIYSFLFLLKVEISKIIPEPIKIKIRNV